MENNGKLSFLSITSSLGNQLRLQFQAIERRRSGKGSGQVGLVMRLYLYAYNSVDTLFKKGWKQIRQRILLGR